MRTSNLPLLTAMFATTFLGACQPEDVDKDDTDTFEDSDTPDETDDGLPTTPEIRFVNAAPTTTDDLVVELVNPQADATYRWRWSQVAGGPATARPDLNDVTTVPASQTRRDETWAVTVVSTRGGVDSDSVSAQVVVVNTAPVATVVITPDPATAGVDLVADAQATDADGDEVDFIATWTRDGASTAWTDLTVGGSFVSRDERWVVVVTPTDGTDSGLPVTDDITIANSPPIITTATLAPLAPTTVDTLRATVASVDPDGDRVSSVSYTWFINGTAHGAATLVDTLDDSLIRKGDVIYFEARGTDQAGATGEAKRSNSVTVVNSVPSFDSVELTPLVGDVRSTFTCTAAGWIDLDGDPEQYAFAWQLDGDVIVGQTGATLAGNLALKHKELTCSAAPTDGQGVGFTLTSNGVRLSNAPPSITSASLLPATLHVGVPVTVNLVGATDPDGDVLTYRYTWSKNGTPIPGVTTSSLVSGFVPGDVLRATVTPVDVEGLAGGAVVSSSGTVRNRLPRVTEVSLLPTVLRTNTPAMALASAVDDDGQPVTITYRWRVNDVKVREVADTGGDGDTLAATEFVKGDRVEVTALPSDGSPTFGDPRTAGPRVVSNTAPYALGVNINPPNPVEGSTITCTPFGFGDADGDAEAYRWRWRVNDRLFPSASGSITGIEFSKGDDVSCIAIPWDLTDEGAQLASASVQVGNTAPTLASVTIGPNNPTAFDILGATFSGAADVDGDPVTYRYRWVVDGEEAGASATLAGAAWKPASEIQLFVRPFDGSLEGPEIGSNIIIAINQRPDIVGVKLLPGFPRTGDDITASASVIEFDGEELTTAYTWFVNDVEIVGVTGDTLPSSHTQRGDRVAVTVVVEDPNGATDTETSPEVVIGNTPPSMVSAAVSPAVVTETTVVTCVGSGWNDVDGDTPQYRTTWFRDLAQVGGGDTLTGAVFDKGHRLTCRLTPFDDDESGTPVNSPGVVVENTPPTLTGVSLSETSPDADAELSVLLGVSDDVDPADTVTYAYRWLVNGTEVAQGAKLTSEHFFKGDEIQVAVRPYDAVAYGPEVLSDVAVALNTPPEILGVIVGPSGATQDDTLELEILADDRDGDSISYMVTWYVNGTEVASGVDLLTLAPGSFFTTDLVTVDVVPNDGDADGALYSSLPLLIGNAPPSITSVAIAPIPAFEKSTLTCTPSGWFDPDGDPEGYLYRWLVNGTVKSANTTLVGNSFNKGDEVWCRVIPTDAFSTGDPVDSEHIIIQNTPPRASSVALTRINPREADFVGVSVLQPFDDDGDILTTTLRWLVNGAEVSTATLLTGASYDKGDTIQAEATISDGSSSITLLTAITTAANTLPIVTGLTVTPPDPFVTQDVEASSTFFDPDPDDAGLVTVSYTWTVAATPLPLVTGSTLLSGNFTKGDTIQVAATASDPVGAGTPYISDVLTARNTPPRITGVEITPDSPTKGTGAECVVLGSEDDDGDDVLYRYQWYVNELATSTSSTLVAGLMSRGDTLRCEVSGYDDEEYGPVMVSETVAVVNAKPTVAAVNVNPTEVKESTVPTAQVLGINDLDGDVVTWRVFWYVDEGAPFESPAIDGTRFSRGQTLRVEVLPNDSFEDGARVSSPTITVVNSPPSVVGPIVTDPLSFSGANAISVSAGSKDDDGDTVTLRWAFIVNGTVVQDDWANSISPGSYRFGDTMQVRATPWDGTVFGAPLTTAGFVVENSVPTVPQVTAPATANPGVDSPVCSISTPSTDADGAAVQYQFRWRDGTATLTRSPSAATSNALEASFIAQGSIWQCDARAYDGTIYSAWSNTAVVVGRYPYLASCLAHLAAGSTTSGVYRVDPDGIFGSQAPFDAWCDMSTGGGGWARVLRTDGQSEDYGQRTYNIVNSFVGVTASRGVYEAFRGLPDFNEVMLKKVSGPQAGEYAALVLNGPSGLTMLEYMETCRDEGTQPGVDPAFEGPRTVGHTSISSGAGGQGNLRIFPDDGSASVPVSRFFMCGVSLSDDNDVSYLTFADSSGAPNTWGDRWRGTGQTGTIWSFANGDYCCAQSTHIGGGTLEALAGWKGLTGTQAATQHAGTYELYVR